MKHYGCIPDLVGHDPTFGARRQPFLPLQLPVSIDHRIACPPVMNQMSESSCVAHALVAAMRYNRINNDFEDIPLSRNWLYWHARNIERMVSYDSGCQIRDAITAAQTIGVPAEADWPYDLTLWEVKPPEASHVMRAAEAERVDVDPTEIKTVLTLGKPVICGITVYPSFESSETEATGIVTMPDLRRERPMSGHAMLCVGYGQKPGTFTMLNSWGPEWGDAGYCYIPEEYLGSPSYGADYWVVYNTGDMQ